MLFAQDQVTVPAWVMIVTTIGGSVMTWLAPQVWKWLGTRREQAKEDRAETRQERREALDEAYKLIDRLRQDVDRAEVKQDKTEAQLQTRIDELAARHGKCEVKYERAITRIEYLEERLKQVDPTFRPPPRVEDSDTHRPLPPDPGSQP